MGMYLIKCNIMSMNPPRKRGVKVDTKISAVESLDNWFKACALYCTNHKHIRQAAFLKSTISGYVFSGTKSEQTSFCSRLELFGKNELKCGSFKRQRKREFDDVEGRLIQYIKLC